MQDVNNRRNWGQVCMNSVLSAQFFCKGKTALKQTSTN